MIRIRSLVTLALCAAIGGGLAAVGLHAADAPSPTTAPAAGNTLDEINADLQAAGKEIHAIMPSIDSLADAQFRKDNAAKAVPVLRKIVGDLNELATTYHEQDAAMVRFSYLRMAVALGDKDSAGELAAIAAGKDVNQAMMARCTLALGNWIHASDDAAEQQKVLDNFTAIAKADPTEDNYADVLWTMSSFGAATDALSKKALLVIRDDLTGDSAKQYNVQIALLDKPLVSAGRTTTGGHFSTASLKGKVVLLDFWATWCVPCRESLPEVKEIYKTYHDKGLEIVGLDCDGGDDVVTAFTKQNGMPWTQLREKSQTEQDSWSPLAKKYGVSGIPTMFLIDKKGVLRYIDARQNTAEKVKKLLAEPDGDAPKAPGK